MPVIAGAAWLDPQNTPAQSAGQHLHKADAEEPLTASMTRSLSLRSVGWQFALQEAAPAGLPVLGR